MEDRGTSHCVDGVEPVCGGSWDIPLHSWSRACIGKLRIPGCLLAYVDLHGEDHGMYLCIAGVSLCGERSRGIPGH